MKIFKTINLVLLTLLSLAAGAAKVTKMPQEMEFFLGAGFSANVLVMFGAVQLLGGLMLIFLRFRLAGAAIIAATMLLSAVLIFMTGNIVFGLVSLVPVLMADFIILDAIRNRKQLAQLQ